MSSFDHFLITRFNIPIDNWKHTKNGMPILSDEWYNSRFFLFENYCIPSVKNQINQDFKWIICLAENTPNFVLQRLEKLQARYSKIIPFFTTRSSIDLDNELHTFLLNHSEGGEYFITTRLDNDDLIHENFIETIQDKFLARNRVVIDLRHGYQMTGEGRLARKVVNHHQIFNHFISVVFHRKTRKTVYHRRHSQWWWFMKVVVEKQTPLWIEFIHELNLVNDFHQKAMPQIINEREFGL